MLICNLPYFTITKFVDTDGCLGYGVSGMVYKATLQINDEKIQAAAKTIKKRVKGNYGFVDVMALKDLLGEIKILSYVGNHNHVIRLLGAYTANLRIGRIYVFLEFCGRGSLDKLLQAFKTKIDNGTGQGNMNQYENVTEVNESSSDVLALLIKWAREVADGMEHLASKKYCKSHKYKSIKLPIIILYFTSFRLFMEIWPQETFL